MKDFEMPSVLRQFTAEEIRTTLLIAVAVVAIVLIIKILKNGIKAAAYIAAAILVMSAAAGTTWAGLKVGDGFLKYNEDSVSIVGDSLVIKIGENELSLSKDNIDSIKVEDNEETGGITIISGSGEDKIEFEIPKKWVSTFEGLRKSLKS